MEVFGAVTSAITLIQIAKKRLDRARNIGDSIDDLRVILSELLEIQDDIDPNTDNDELIRLSQLVYEATELIQNNHKPARRALTFLWTNTLDQDVQRINRNLEGIYRRLESRARRRARTSSVDTQYATPNGYTEPEPPIKIQDPSIAQRIKRKPVGGRDLSGAVNLPTTLILQDSNHDTIGMPLQLEWFSILERTSRFRAIQYQSYNYHVTVTHEIQFGTIPCTPDELEATEVSFLDNQLLTVETDTEYAVYLLHPLYKFYDTYSCNNFMAQIRERKLLATFLAKEILKLTISDSSFLCFPSSTSQSLLLARWKVIRIWERILPENAGLLITLTFHDRSKKPPKFTEKSLEDFRPGAVVVKHGLAVDLSRRTQGSYIFQFGGEIITPITFSEKT